MCVLQYVEDLVFPEPSPAFSTQVEWRADAQRLDRAESAAGPRTHTQGRPARQALRFTREILEHVAECFEAALEARAIDLPVGGWQDPRKGRGIVVRKL